LQFLYYFYDKDKPVSPDEIVQKVWSVYKEYGHNLWALVDGSARGVITQLKIAFDENVNYKKAEDVSLHSNRIIPVNFVTEHKLFTAESIWPGSK